MNSLGQFKKEIYTYALICAVLIELVSIPIIGAGTEFAYGIGLGTLIAIANFSLMALAGSLMITTKNTFIGMLGYMIRMVLSAAAVLIALKISVVCAAGTVAGLLTIQLAIFFLYIFKKGKKKSLKITEKIES